MSKARDLANAGTALTAVSATELGYLDGVTSAVQTQINGRVPATIVDAKGDIIAASASDTVARLAVGSNDTVLTADSSTATGLKWAAPATPATTKSFSLLNSGGTSLSGQSSVTISGISNMDDIYIFVNGCQSSTTGNMLGLRINADSTNKYGFAGMRSFYENTNSNSGIAGLINQAPNSISYIDIIGGNYETYTTQSASARISGGATSGVKMVQVIGGTNGYRGNAITGMGQYTGTSAISSITLFSLVPTNFSNGTIYVYGAN
jgi:hypothetical protein